MDRFLEQLDFLKTLFFELPEECLQEAMDHIDQTVEQMAQSVVYVDNPSTDCLVDTGKHVVQDFLYGPDIPGPSSAPPTSDDFFIDFSEQNNSENSELFCFSCGISFKNRKGLWRHGLKSGHQTRTPSKNSKSENSKSEFAKISTYGFEEFLENEKSIKCEECKLECSNRKALYRHGKLTNHKTYPEKRTRKVKGGPMQCPECDYNTEKIQNLRLHFNRNHTHQKRISKK